jgi:hypothetical protein
MRSVPFLQSLVFPVFVLLEIQDVKLTMVLDFALTASNASMMHVRGMVPLNFMGSDALCFDAVGGMQFTPAVVAGGAHVGAIGSRLELPVAVAPVAEGVDSARARFREGWGCSW